MDEGLNAALIFGVVTIAMIAQGWVSLLEHQRRRQTLDVIKAALQAGREPPAELYALLRKDAAPKAPWAETLVFGALAIGFWLAFAVMEEDRRSVFLVIAATMTVTSLGCAAIALWGSKSRDDERP